METNQPLKRSAELAPLSREHHDGLQFVWKLREGIKSNLAPGRLKAFTVFYWQQHIRPHFFHEEQVLAKHIPADNPFLIQMNEEHALIREMMLSLGNDTTPENFSNLADILYNHIRFEERQLFQWAEDNLTKEQLQEIYKQLEEHPLTCAEWHDEFWLKK